MNAICSNERRTSAWTWLLWAVLVALALFQLGRAYPVKLQWSQHIAGPLVCVSNGMEMQCAARQMVVLPPGVQPPAGLQEQSGELSAQQLGCVALAVFSEARGESYLGQAAVAQVVLNRALKAAQTPCEAVTEVAQFQGIEQMTDDPWRVDAEAWKHALQVAEVVAMRDYDTGACARATAFHARSGDPPDWAAKLKLVCRVGAHQFYGERQS